MKYILLMCLMSLIACEPISVSGKKNDEAETIDVTKLSDPEIKQMAEEFYDNNNPAKIAQMYGQLKGTLKEYTFRNNLLEHSKDDLEKFSKNLEAMGFNPTVDTFRLQLNAKDDTGKTIVSSGNYLEVIANKIKIETMKDAKITTQQKIEDFYKNIKALADVRTGSLNNVLEVIKNAFLGQDKTINDLMAYFNSNVATDVVAGILSLASKNATDLNAIQNWLLVDIDKEDVKNRKLRILEMANIPITEAFFREIALKVASDENFSDKLNIFYSKLSNDEKIKLRQEDKSLALSLVNQKITKGTVEIVKDFFTDLTIEDKDMTINIISSTINSNDPDLKKGIIDDVDAKKELIEFLDAQKALLQ